MAARQERSFIMVKPDGVQRGVVGEVLQRFERRGYKLVGMKLMLAKEELLRQHYAEHVSKGFFPGLCKFMSSGPVCPMVFEGKDVIAQGRAMMGATDPLKSLPGTLRGDFGVDLGRNIVHGSDGKDSAVREIGLWFKPEELVSYKSCVEDWLYE